MTPIVGPSLAEYGSDIEYTFSIYGPSAYQKEWFQIDESGKVSPVGKDSLVHLILTADHYSGGRYFCKVTDVASEIFKYTDTVDLRVHSIIENDWRVCEGSEVSFSFVVPSKDYFPLQWYHIDAQGVTHKKGTNATGFIIGDVTTDHIGSYFCIGHDSRIDSLKYSDTTHLDVVNYAPIKLTASQTLIPPGSEVVLQVSGASYYKWNTGSEEESITVSPTETTEYSVVGYNDNLCRITEVVTIEVISFDLDIGSDMLDRKSVV